MMWIALVLTAAAQAPTWTITFETRCAPSETPVPGCTADWRPATAACSGEQLRIRVRGPEAWVCATDSKLFTFWPPDGHNSAAAHVAPGNDLRLDMVLDDDIPGGGAEVFQLTSFVSEDDKGVGSGKCPWTHVVQNMEARVPHVDCPASR